MERLVSISSIILLLLAGIFFTSCKKNKRHTDAELIIKEWTGKTVQFPEGVKCKVMEKDTVCRGLFEKQYKILVYTDSTGCTACKLKIQEWKKIMSETDSIAPGQVGFLFFFHPKNDKDLGLLMRRELFDFHIFVDNADAINRLNRFPDQAVYQSFLLDQENRVLLVGNPASNPKIWKLYKQLITGQKSSQSVPLTTVVPDKEQSALEGLQVEKTTKAQFILTNTGSDPLIINDVKTSCGCTVPSWEKQPVKPGSKTVVEVEVKPGESGYFRKTIDVYCNTEEGIIQLTITGMVENKNH